MKVQKTNLKNVLLFERKVFEDFRGTYSENYNEREYSKVIEELTGQRVNFVENDFSVRRQNVVTGLHGNETTWKLISCAFGEFYLVVVNCDENSQEFGKWESFTLSRQNGKQVLVPPKFGNGFLALSDWAVFFYQQSDYYSEHPNTFTYSWDDSRMKIYWPIKNPILSQRDAFFGRDKFQNREPKTT